MQQIGQMNTSPRRCSSLCLSLLYQVTQTDGVYMQVQVENRGSNARLENCTVYLLGIPALKQRMFMAVQP
jgi:hypothetical protein